MNRDGQHGGLRLGFISGRMCSRGTGADAGKLYCHPGLGRLVDALRGRVGQLTVAMSLAPERPTVHDHQVDMAEADFVALPHLPSTIAGLRQDLPCRRVFAEVERRSDAVIVQLPFSPPSALAPAHRPRVYHVCADVPSVVRASPYYQGLRRLVAVGAADAIHLWTRALVHRQRCRVVTNGGALMERLGRPAGSVGVSSSLLAAEVGSVARARPAGAPFRVLFVGYLRPEKGLDVLMAAYARLCDDLPGSELVIVGQQDLDEGGAAREFAAAVAALGARGRVTLRGHLPFGPALFREFADADVLAVPSRSEGTPRVLVEARAFGCPVVGTRVGGIPTSVRDGEDGLLVPPDDAGALHAALLRIAREPALTARLVEHGYAAARRATVDAFALQLLAEVDTLLGHAREAS